MTCRLVLITEIIAPYRIPVFNALMQEWGIDLHVIFLSETDPGLRDWHVYREEIRFSYEVLPSWRSRVGSQSVLLNRGLTSALADAAPNVIACGGYNYAASWQAMSWARRNQVQFLLWIESTERDQRSGKAPIEFLKQKFVKSCDGFIVPGKSSRDYVRSYGISDVMIATAPNAVANQIFEKLASDAIANVARERERYRLPPRYLLFVGRLVPEKGVYDLLQAYEGLDPVTRSELGLVIVGDGPLRRELEHRSAQLGNPSVQLPGFVQRDELATYYALAEMLVFPTHTDTWGLVVNEAMACGLPVIASSAAGCVADLVRNEWNGYVVEPRQTEQVSMAIRRLANCPELRAKMGRRSREIIAQYSPENCAKGIATAALNFDLVHHD
jgi:glycosyltransferase involved in cell wall biosynthesis